MPRRRAANNTPLSTLQMVPRTRLFKERLTLEPSQPFPGAKSASGFLPHSRRPGNAEGRSLADGPRLWYGLARRCRPRRFGRQMRGSLRTAHSIVAGPSPRFGPRDQGDPLRRMACWARHVPGEMAALARDCARGADNGSIGLRPFPLLGSPLQLRSLGASSDPMSIIPRGGAEAVPVKPVTARLR